MKTKYTAPTTRKEARKMIEPLDPFLDQYAKKEERLKAFKRLNEFIDLMLPD